MPTLLSLGQPASLFQFVYLVYLYGLPILLWAAYAWLVIDDQEARAATGESPNRLAILIAIVLPLIGATSVLLASPRTRRRHGLSVILGLLVFLLPLAAGLWLAGGPLGPKALG
jgi:hypothetical protein